ncbi:MAG TPA: ABC transporter substrate-binding protein, partial [Gemmatimonadales bacterium]|nr:ABC transporter substrate-binding protein [Gemmatimonadales bacterium]
MLLSALRQLAQGEPRSASRAGVVRGKNSVRGAPDGAVRVLVLTPRDGATREYGLKVLAGLCLALSEIPEREGLAGSSPRSTLNIDVDVKHSGEPGPRRAQGVTPDQLWRVLTELSKLDQVQLHATVRWGTAAGPHSVRFCFADEARFDPNRIGCKACAPCQIMFGPVTSKAAEAVLERMRTRPDIPILTPAATSTSLTRTVPTPGESQRPKSAAFYRFICPDRAMAERLAEELVYGVRARRIAVLYEDSTYGRGLRADFREALKQRGYQGWDRVPAVSYPAGMARNGGVSVTPKPFDCSLCEQLGGAHTKAPGSGHPVPPSPIRSSQDPREAIRVDLDSVMMQFRAWGADAIGIFGNMDDKKAFLGKYC